MSILTFSVIALWLVMFLVLAALFALARQVGILYERVTPVGAMISNNGPEIGAQAPSLELANLNGQAITLGGATGRSQLVFFLSPTCPICKALIPALRDIAKSERDWVDVILASDGKEAAHRAMISSENLGNFPYALSSELGVAFKVAKLPFAVVIDASGIVRAKGLVNNREQLESLFNAIETGHPSIQNFQDEASAIALQPSN